MIATIIEKGIKVYRDYFCKHCGKRIPWKKWYEEHEIPNYIRGHGRIGKHQTKEWREKHSKDMSGEKNPLWVDGYAHKRHESKRRGFGFIPINEKSKINKAMHHLDNELIIFIPRKLHKSLYHSIKRDINLEEMNNLAWKWFDEEGYKLMLK